MINRTNASAGFTYTPDYSQKTASKKQDKKDSTYDSAFTVDISVSSEGKGSRALKPEEIESIKDQIEQSAASLRDVVEKLILRQGEKSPGLTLSIEIHGTTGAAAPSETDAAAAVSENGEWGVNAVSDRIVSFAKSLAGGDPGKIELLREAIDKGFASAQKTLGGKLPDISNQTYDAVMAKLDEWAAESETAITE